ncbi:MAG: hypothetical protein INF91_06815 [Alphaproteobacteria bacterium]|nr:hypothetical protein [Alphaproteobacteria bacterium]
MTVAATLRALPAGLVRFAALILCLASLFVAQIALAADQVEDMARLGLATDLDDCGVVTPASDSGRNDRAPDPHCQSCCFHHNGQFAGPASGLAHPAGAARAVHDVVPPVRLASAALSAEKDPPKPRA